MPAANAPPKRSLPARDNRNVQWRAVWSCGTESGASAACSAKGSGRGTGGGGPLSVIAEILELGRAIFGITISHCTVEPEGSASGLAVPSLTRGAPLSRTFFVAGKSETGGSLKAMTGTVDLADSSATNNVDHCTRNSKLTARSPSPASPLVSPIGRRGSTILACESNMYDLPGEPAEMSG